MANVRTTFRLAYKVKNGSAVLNEFAQEVGVVIDCKQLPETSGEVDGRGHLIEGPQWEATADVSEDALKGKLQCLEPTFAVS